MLYSHMLGFASLASLALALPANKPIAVSDIAPQYAGIPLEAFVSYSIEFSSFPEFAGNKSHPNVFSDNLLSNLGKLTGTKPYVRVGGNTQDYYLYDPNLPVALVGSVDPSRSPDYPTTISIGPSYFESYSTFPNAKYIHGFNLGKNGTAARTSLLATVPLACKALEDGKLAYWELGNEPDLYKTSAQGHVRPPTWTERDYVNEWLEGTRAIKKALAEVCPDLVTKEKYGYYAPSFAGTSNSLNPITTWKSGLDTDEDVRVVSSHNYISGATSPGVTLQGTLMNHTSTTHSISSQLNESHLLLPLAPPNTPFILGETNSLYNQGRPGLSNSFGAALWGIDFNLWCAANNISRVHMHQGTNYRYQSWQPVDTALMAKGTKAPYYGNVAVAAMVGDLTKNEVKIANIPLASPFEAAYAAYVDGKLARIAVINMVEYDYTDTASPAKRPMTTYTFQLSDIPLARTNGGKILVQRLLSNGSNAITGITWDGYSYSNELNNGKPVLLRNVTKGETVEAEGPNFRIGVPYSSAAILNFRGVNDTNGDDER